MNEKQKPAYDVINGWIEREGVKTGENEQNRVDGSVWLEWKAGERDFRQIVIEPDGTVTGLVPPAVRHLVTIDPERQRLGWGKDPKGTQTSLANKR